MEWCNDLDMILKSPIKVEHGARDRPGDSILRGVIWKCESIHAAVNSSEPVENFNSCQFVEFVAVLLATNSTNLMKTIAAIWMSLV